MIETGGSAPFNLSQTALSNTIVLSNMYYNLMNIDFFYLSLPFCRLKARVDSATRRGRVEIF